MISKRLYFLWSRRNIFSSEFKNKNLCLLSWMILTLTFAKNTAFVVFWRFLILMSLSMWRILNDDVVNCFEVSLFVRANNVFLNLKSYISSFENNLVAIFEALFKLVWIIDATFAQSISEFSMKKNLKAIFIVWFVLYDCSFVCEW